MCLRVLIHGLIALTVAAFAYTAQAAIVATTASTGSEAHPGVGRRLPIGEAPFTPTIRLAQSYGKGRAGSSTHRPGRPSGGRRRKGIGGIGVAIGVGIAIQALSAAERERRRKLNRKKKKKKSTSTARKRREERRRRAAEKKKKAKAKALARARARAKAKAEARRKRLAAAAAAAAAAASTQPTGRHPDGNANGHTKPQPSEPGRGPDKIPPTDPPKGVVIIVPPVFPPVEIGPVPPGSRPQPPAGNRQPVPTPQRATTPPRRPSQPGTAPPPPPTAVAAADDRFWPREIVAQIDRFLPPATDDAIAQDYNLQRLTSDTNLLLDARFVHYRVPDQRTADAVIAALANDNRVLFAQRNNRYELSQSYSKNANASDLQYALTKIRLSAAHAVAQGRGVKVAVIDSGIDRKHPDLAAAVTAHCDAAPGKGAAVDTHGTAVAGIIRARGLAKGVAPQADILAVRAFYDVAAHQGPQSSTMILLRAIDWIAAKRAHVVNMSFAGAKDATIARAISKLLERRIHLVAAGGNNGPDAPPAYPAAYQGVIAVTATDYDDKLYDRANRGPYIAIAAPGVDVFVIAPNSTHSFLTGTSMAAAHISGLIALIIESRPRLDHLAVREALAATAIDLGKPGHDVEFGAGRVDAEALLQSGTKALAKR